jgi:hypothetical protein
MLALVLGGSALARAQAPTNTSLPTITGTVAEGRTLTATNGVWTGTGTITYTYQWRRCDAAGTPASCTAITGATSQTYVLVAADVGSTLSVRVTATDSTGSADADSAATTVVTTGSPLAQVVPSISGSTVQGQSLTANPGTWTGTQPIAFTYEWQRCDSLGDNCVIIGGATGSTHTLAASDVGSRIRLRIGASNSVGSVGAESTATSVVTGSGSGSTGSPVNTGSPTVFGTAAQGSTLTASVGTWTGAATITYAYQWLRCDDLGLGCSSIFGATGSARTVDTNDVESRLRIRITASNSVGSSSAESSATAVVTGSGSGQTGAPVNTVLPTISGTPARGQTLTATTGTWTGAATITYTYQWLRCETTSVADCVDIAGATTRTHVVEADDLGFRLRIEVTARNSSGSDTVESLATAEVTGTGTTPTPGEPGEPVRCSTSIQGAVELAGGRISIPSTSVSLPEQLLVEKVQFTPNPVRSRTRSLRIQVRISDTRGCLVRDALVFVRSVPVLTSTPPEGVTGRNGAFTVNVQPRAAFPLGAPRTVQFFVRVRKPGDSLLTGVGTRRLVQVRTAAP